MNERSFYNYIKKHNQNHLVDIGYSTTQDKALIGKYQTHKVLIENLKEYDRIMRQAKVLEGDRRKKTEGVGSRNLGGREGQKGDYRSYEKDKREDGVKLSDNRLGRVFE